MLVLLRSPAGDRPPDHRGTTQPAPVLVAPIGSVANAGSLTWQRVVEADRYRVTLFDATGTTLYAAEVADTVVALPDSIALIPGAAYLWKVDARTGFDRWVTSDLADFSIVGPRRR